MPFISISAPSIVSGMSGESEKTLRETFEEAQVGPPRLTLRQSLAHSLSLTPGVLTTIENRTLPAIHRRDRRHHAEARDGSARDGAPDCRPAADAHGRCVPFSAPHSARVEADPLESHPQTSHGTGRHMATRSSSSARRIGQTRSTQPCGGRVGSTARLPWECPTRAVGRSEVIRPSDLP